MSVILFLSLVWGLLILCFWYSRPGVILSDKIQKMPSLQGHRGFTGDAIENTLESLIASQRLGLEMCEFDVRITADQVPILFHDQNTKRIFGVDREVHKLTLAEIRKLGQVSTLREVLESPQVASWLNIEIKSVKVFNRQLVNSIMSDVARYGSQKNILISSFNPFVLRQVAKHPGSEVLRALLVTEADEPGNRHFLKKMWLMKWSRCHMLNLDMKMIHKGRMLYFKNLKIPIAAWTVNESFKARELLEMGVTSVITDCLNPQDLK